MVFDAYAQFEESVLTAQMKAAQQTAQDSDPVSIGDLFIPFLILYACHCFG